MYSGGPFTVENGRKLGERFIRDHNGALPDAVIVAADVIAVGVLQAFNAVGVIVPRDISVISINNQTIAQLTSPPLSTFAIDQNELARVAILHVGRCDRQQTDSPGNMCTCPRRWRCATASCRNNDSRNDESRRGGVSSDAIGVRCAPAR